MYLAEQDRTRFNGYCDNNVSLPLGNYTVAITVNREKAEFTIAAPTS